MEKLKNWQGIPYYPINQYYKEVFGEKVYKISVSVPGTCPNREGLKGMKPCIFCDEYGSAAFPEFQEQKLTDQIRQIKDVVRIRNKVNRFLIYFQAYTSTFQRVQTLRDYFEVAVKDPDVCGLVVGTRPDCLSDSLFDLWNEFVQRLPVFVEFGVQSFDNKRLQWMERGHTAEKAYWAIDRVRKLSPKVNVGIHLILGLPGETKEEVIQAALKTNELNVDNVKLHNLHVLANTPLQELYERGEFTPLTREQYADRVALYLSYLDPQIAVHRLTAVASRHDELVAPSWTKEKMRSYQFVVDHLKDQKVFQGQKLD